MLIVVQFHDPSDLFLEVGTIVGDDLLQYSKPADDVVLYEAGHMLGFQYRVGGCLYSLGEVFNRH